MIEKSKSFSRFTSRPRKTVRLSEQELIKTGYLEGDEGRFPLVVEPQVEQLDPVSWAESNRGFIDRKLLDHGAILFRGCNTGTVEKFQAFARAVSSQLLDYQERAAPRMAVGKNVYTSTEFPADQVIPMHHEMSYSHNWPTRIFFYCDLPATSGGCTPIADDRKVLNLIDPEVKARFLEKGVMYVRNYGEGVDLSWQDAFQTDDKAQVEAYARKAGMEVEWRSESQLRTRSPRQVLATHPKTGDTVWFNHAHMFHESNLPEAVRSALRSEFAPDELPRNAFYGDGTPIEDSVAEHIRQVYSDAAVRFPWQQGDVLLVDNFLASHGRDPFEGPRRILVIMAELYDSLAA